MCKIRNIQQNVWKNMYKKPHKNKAIWYYLHVGKLSNSTSKVLAYKTTIELII